MLVKAKKKLTISMSEKDFLALENVHSLGPCTAVQVQEALREQDLLKVMRRMHTLVDRGLLKRVVIGKQRLYTVKSNYKALVRMHVEVTAKP